MKKVFLAAFSLALLLVVAGNGTAQSAKVLIHYWNFDGVTAQTISPSMPQIPDIASDFSSVSTPKPRVMYYLLPGTSLTASTRYIDNTTGSDSNARYSVVPTGAGGNQGLRLRNPLDSMELRVVAPTTGFTGIVVSYALESSSTASGDSTNVFDYSVDGGVTWKNGKANGMKVNGSNVDTLDTTPLDYQGASWGIVRIDLSADKTVENNPNFVFRFRFRGNTSLAKGNNRFDNLTFEGNGNAGAPKPTISLKTPAASAILIAGRHTSIAFDTAHGVTPSRTIEFSADGGTTWSSIATANTSTAYDWTVPSTPTVNGMVRVKDDNGIIGASGKFSIFVVDKSKNKIIHYWDFNTVTSSYHNPGIPLFPADFSASQSAPGSIAYVLQSGAPSNYAGYIDNVAGDTANSYFGQPAGNGFRLRNPVDMVELHFNIPTTGFKNIAIKYLIEESSNVSPLTRNFDYSVDGGTTWKTAGLSLLTESNLDSTKFDPVLLNFGSDASVNDNANLVLRMKFTGGGITGTSGNDRFDNFSVTGDPNVNSVETQSTSSWNCTAYPNPATDHLLISTPSEGPKTIKIMDMTGKEIQTENDSRENVLINTSKLAAGVYVIEVVSLIDHSESRIKFVKE